MNVQTRLAACAALGKRILEGDEYLDAVVHRTSHTNPWFTKENQKQALDAIAQDMLKLEKLEAWVGRYDESFEPEHPQRIGLVLAGNIPLVGFHDWLSVLVSGHRAIVKLSDKDPYLLPALQRLLVQIDERFAEQTTFVEKLQGFQAIIATGSNNSARYFEAYFGKYPHIIRRNRNAVALLNGEETKEDYLKLGKDIFQYYGLGCRNVSKLYVPESYDFEPLLEQLHSFKEVILNGKYKNNFDYQLAMDLLNKSAHYNNGCLILREHAGLASPISTVHFEYYQEIDSLEKEMERRLQEIQCIVAPPGMIRKATFSFGQAQRPALWDYADGEDTLAFLTGLSN